MNTGVSHLSRPNHKSIGDRWTDRQKEAISMYNPVHVGDTKTTNCDSTDLK